LFVGIKSVEGSIVSTKRRLKGYVLVRQLKSAKARIYYAYWRDESGAKHDERLGPAHVRDTGRKTAGGAVIWRAGDGPRPSPEHLTPQDAEVRLDELLCEREAQADAAASPGASRVLYEATEGWMAERHAERGLKRSTIADYKDLFESASRLAAICRGWARARHITNVYSPAAPEPGRAVKRAVTATHATDRVRVLALDDIPTLAAELLTETDSQPPSTRAMEVYR
jgi:hypothetical protein